MMFYSEKMKDYTSRTRRLAMPTLQRRTIQRRITHPAELYNIYTLRTSLSRQASPFSPPTGSFTHPASVPTFLLKALRRSLPYIRPFGSTTGSFSTILLVWCAYGTLRASSFNSVLHMGHTVVVDEEALAEEDV